MLSRATSGDVESDVAGQMLANIENKLEEDDRCGTWLKMWDA